VGSVGWSMRGRCDGQRRMKAGGTGVGEACAAVGSDYPELISCFWRGVRERNGL
jgi:hypothetical protein